MDPANLNAVGDTEPALQLFASLLDRKQTEMPKDYLLEAHGAAVAGDATLKAIGCRPGSKRPRGWHRSNPDVFRRGCAGTILQVRGCGDFWVVERFRDGDWLDPSGGIPGLNLYALACADTERLMMAPTYQAAMRLAQHCHPAARPPIHGYWAQVYPSQHAEFVARFERKTRGLH